MRFQTSAGEVKVYFRYVQRKNITHPDTQCVIEGAGIDATGTASCYHKDRFVKAHGRARALFKALESVTDRKLRTEIYEGVRSSGCTLQEPVRTPQKQLSVA